MGLLSGPATSGAPVRVRGQCCCSAYLQRSRIEPAPMLPSESTSARKDKSGAEPPDETSRAFEQAVNYTGEGFAEQAGVPDR